MTAYLGDWVKSIAAIAIISGIAMALTPPGKTKKVLWLLCGILIIMAIISPILDDSLPTLSMDMADYRRKAESIVEGTQEEADDMNRLVIESNCREYIIDKADSMEIELYDVGVSAKWGDEGYWYPYEITLYADIPDYEKKRLSNAIESELGIPSGRQNWSSYEN